MRIVRSAAWLLVAALVSSAPLVAQSFQGGLRGVVKDAQGVIPGASVTIVNESNNITRETVTNGVGEYSFPALDPGSTPSRRRFRDTRPSSVKASASARRTSSGWTSSSRSAPSRKRSPSPANRR